MCWRNRLAAAYRSPVPSYPASRSLDERCSTGWNTPENRSYSWKVTAWRRSSPRTRTATASLIWRKLWTWRTSATPDTRHRPLAVADGDDGGDGDRCHGRDGVAFSVPPSCTRYRYHPAARLPKIRRDDNDADNNGSNMQGVERIGETNKQARGLNLLYLESRSRMLLLIQRISLRQIDVEFDA